MTNSSDKPTVWSLILVLVRKKGVDKRDPEELHTLDEILQRLCRGMWVCLCMPFSLCAQLRSTALQGG